MIHGLHSELLIVPDTLAMLIPRPLHQRCQALSILDCRQKFDLVLSCGLKAVTPCNRCIKCTTMVPSWYAYPSANLSKAKQNQCIDINTLAGIKVAQ